MSQFEYVIVLTSFFVAFGASELLAGWGRQYLHRTEAKPYPLQLAASVFILLALLQSVWGYWGFRDTSWTFGGFLLVLVPLLPLVGAAYLIMPPRYELSAADPQTHYGSVYRAVFALIAVWVLLGTVAEIALVGASFHLGQIVRIVAVALLVGLGNTSDRRLHWAGLGFLVVLQLSFIRVVTPALE